MKFPIKFIGLFFALIMSFTAIYSQESNLFVSDGGFSINLPKTVTSAENTAVNDAKLGISAVGKAYSWVKPQTYHYQVIYYKLTSNKKTLTIADKNLLLETYRESYIEQPKREKLLYIEKEHSFNGNKGVELQVILSDGKAKSIGRFFIVGQRMFFINVTFNRNQDETEIVRVMDSFSLLDSKALIDAKIEEATPKPLPQEPVAAKLKTDAQDKNLKGKVKSIVEEDQEATSKNRERDYEEYYNESGNLTKEISFSEGYPNDVTIWGYIDGQRVLKSNYISFDDDQRPPSRRMTITASVEDNAKNPNLPKDTRYSVKKTYKYNEKGQVIEEQTHSNNGELWSRTVFNYKGNEREELNYGQDGSQWSRTVEILDKNGDVIERNLMDAQDKIGTKIISTYKYDAQGNWVVKKDVEKVIVRGKTVLKPLWISYRTITYYQ